MARREEKEPTGLETQEAPAPADPSTEEPGFEFNPDAALERVDGDSELLAQIISMFLEDLPRRTARIEAAIEARDARGLNHEAHTLKGILGNFGCPPATEAARMLESFGAEGDLTNAKETYQRLCRLLEPLQKALLPLSLETVS